jgi:2'-5' RNA ligase
MRLFVAVPVNDAVKAEAAKVAAALRQSKAKLKLVEPENVHVTLRFLGEAGDAGPFIEAIDAVGEKPFRVVFDSVGAFPSKEYVRVVWIGCSEGGQTLKNIHRVFSEKAGLPSEAYVPHVTIARVHGKPDDAVRKALETPVSAEMLADRMLLVESTLGPRGPAYKVLHEKRL